MEVKGDLLTDKDNAGAALLEAFKEVKDSEPVPVGSYRGFQTALTAEGFYMDCILTLKGQMSHRVELGKDARGNLTRIDNVLNAIPARLNSQKCIWRICMRRWKPPKRSLASRSRRRKNCA